MRDRFVGLFAIGLATLAASVSAQVVRIDPSNPNLQYTGRWNFDLPDEPWVAWKTSSVLIRFNGTDLSGEFDPGSSPEYVRVIIDGVPNVATLPMPPVRATYVLASGLSNGPHVVEIMKETFYGSSMTFYGLALSGTITPPPPKPPRRIEFFGDSNMDGTSLYSDHDSGFHGSYYAFPAVLGRMLDAEVNDQSVSGAQLDGVGPNDVRSFIFSEDYYTEDPIYRSGFDPEVIVVNAGANDIYGANQATIKNRYKAVIADLRTVYGPAPHIVLFNAYGWDAAEPANYSHEVLAEVGNNVSVCLFPWMWEQWHGSMIEHSGEASVLVDHILALGLGFKQQRNQEVFDGFGRNFDFANGSFEHIGAAGMSAFGWRYAGYGVDRVLLPAGAPHGNYVLRLIQGKTVHQGTDATGDMAPGGTIKLQQYSVTAQIRSTAATGTARILADYETQPLYQRANGQSQTFQVTNSWQPFTATFTAPLGTWKTYVSLEAVAGTIEFDDVRMTDASLPTGVLAYGSSSPGCRGPIGISVSSDPQIGNAGFAFTCVNAPVLASGLFLHGLSAATPPISLFGTDLLIDPSAPMTVRYVTADPTGVASVASPIPNNPGFVGVDLKAQFLWLSRSAPAPCPALGVAASRALAVTIQP